MVRRVTFEGNSGLFSGQNDLQLRGAMEQRASPPFVMTWPLSTLVTPRTLSVDTLRLDARRIEVWLAHRGHFNARFEGWELRRLRPRTARLAGVIDVIGRVVPGPPSLVRHFEVTGQGGRTSAVGTVVRSVLVRSGLGSGSSFDLAVVDSVRVQIVEALQNEGYAYAKASLSVDAFPEEAEGPDPIPVDVAIDLDPGRTARFGEVTVRGTRNVPPELVSSSIVFNARTDRGRGDTFQLNQLRRSQQRIFETGLFSIVNIEPDLSDPTAEEVPVRVDVTEGRFRRLRVGAGVMFDYFTLGPRTNIEYQDLRFAGTNLQFDAKAGVGAVVGVVQDDEGGTRVVPTGLGELRFEYPWLLRRQLSIAAGARFRQDVQFGTIPYREFTLDLGTVWRFRESWSLRSALHAEYFLYLEPGLNTLEAARLQFGGDFTGASYLLPAIDVGLRADFRDDLLAPRRGSYWNLDLRQSLPVPPSLFSPAADAATRGFLYTKIDADLRGWAPVRLSKKQRTYPMVLAGRLHGIGLIPWRTDGALPYPDLAFLGGPNSLRGYRSNQVGPYDSLCTYPRGRPNPQHNNGRPYDMTRTYLPRGGAVAMEALGEVRYDLPYGLAAAVFIEGGMLARQWRDLGLDSLRTGAGFGIRYASPVGPIRLDIGLRGRYDEDFSARSYIGCNPIDQLPRGFDLATSSRGARERLRAQTTSTPFGSWVPPAVNIFLSIGEAF